MLSLMEAYDKVRFYRDGFPRIVLNACYDFGDEFAFSFSTGSIPKDQPMIGLSFDIINKRTGVITKRPTFLIGEKLTRGKRIDVEQFE